MPSPLTTGLNGQLRRRLTLNNLQAGPVSRVVGLALLDLLPQPLADGLGNGGAVNLLGRHGQWGAREEPAAASAAAMARCRRRCRSI